MFPFMCEQGNLNAGTTVKAGCDAGVWEADAVTAGQPGGSPVIHQVGRKAAESDENHRVHQYCDTFSMQERGKQRQ